MPEWRPWGALACAFAALREEADQSGEREVFAYLSSRGACERVLRLLVSRPVVAVAANAAGGLATSFEGQSERGPEGTTDLRLLTWNISEVRGVATRSVQAPDTWTEAENREAVQREVLRWDADIVALQECPSARALPLLVAERYKLVGSSRQTHAGFVHLYVRHSWEAPVEDLASEVPGVAGAIVVNDIRVVIVAVHLEPTHLGAALRGKQLRGALRGRDSDTVVVMGDMNMIEKDATERVRHHRLGEAVYDGLSWNPRVSRYLAWDAEGEPERGQQYDRVWFRGGIFAYAYLVGNSRFFQDGQDFVLSDHFGVLALASVHAAHRGTAGTAVVRGLKAMLARRRDEEAGAEAHLVRERQREGWARAALMKARREDRERGETLARRKGVEKAARARQKALRDAALGPGSLFSEADYKTVRADVVAPSAMVSAGSGAGAGSVSVDALCAGRYPVLGCLRCEAWAGYIASVCQVLLRTPAVAAWLRGHVDQ